MKWILLLLGGAIAGAAVAYRRPREMAKVVEVAEMTGLDRLLLTLTLSSLPNGPARRALRVLD